MTEPCLKLIGFLLLTLCFPSSNATCESLCKESCCEVKKDEFRCCPYINGVCCTDGNSCCPQGSECSSDSWTCKFPNGVMMVKKRLISKNETTEQLTRDAVLTDTPVICPDRTSACPANSTCCQMDGGSYGCCNSPQAVCCPDKIHCCPHGTVCNMEKSGCDPVEQHQVHAAQNEIDKFLSLLFLSDLGRARTDSDRANQRTSQGKPVWNALTSTGVQCDDSHQCPTGTTCCRDEFGSYACCPFPRAVCCADKTHCCPENYDCDENSGRCISRSLTQTDPSLVEQSTMPKDSSLKDEQLCPDQHSRCPYSATCCQLKDKSWGCCPLTEAVCCSDGLHCCPSGFKCNSERGTCVKLTANRSLASALPAPPPAPKVICPNAEFQCDNTSTCCPLPNDEWACCPFRNAVCCTDLAHCCPENTTCDIEHNRCVPKPNTTAPSNPPDFIPMLSKFPHRLACSMTCPKGTCCKDNSGLDACCPHENAVCCSDGMHCCPHNTKCDENSGTCRRDVNVQEEPQSIPWLKKTPALQRTPEETNAESYTHGLRCLDPRYSCKRDQSCCPLATGGYGCCPFANGTCCSDLQHCCPANTVCDAFGQCIRQLPTQLKQTVSQALRMQPTTGKSSLPSMPNPFQRKANTPVYAEWCGGLCPDSGFCCTDASGRPRQRCCPATAGVCCPDGEHCCPRGTRCVGNGQCQSEDTSVQKSFAPYLVPAMNNKGKTAEFVEGIVPESRFHMSSAKKSTLSKLNPMFLLDSYYQLNSQKVTVCPDLERSCSLDQQCCSSFKNRYVCAPKGTTCCPYTADSFCPPGTTCSHDGRLCMPV